MNTFYQNITLNDMFMKKIYFAKSQFFYNRYFSIFQFFFIIQYIIANDNLYT